MDESESTAPQQAIVLTIRPSSGSTFTTAISIDSTVLQLKEKLATADLPAASIRLVYSGRVLKDEDQLSVYSIKEGHTLHMVKSASNRANEQAVQTVRPNANINSGADGFDEQAMMRTFLENPAIRDMMSNPEMLRRVMMANPQTREVMENNPEVAQMLNDPAFLRQSLDMARNPKLMKQALRNNDRALSNMEMIPGGFNHLRRMYHNVQEPMEASRSAPQPSTDDLNERFAARLNADTRPNAGTLNSTPLPNPWAPPPRRNNNTGSMPGFPGIPGMGGNPAGGLGFNPFTGNPFASFGGPTSGAGANTGASAGTGAGTAGTGANATGGSQQFQNPFAAMMGGQGMGGGNQASSLFGLPPMGNNPEMFQQIMQFNQMMRQMEHQQPPSSQPSSQLPPGLPSFANMFGGFPPVAQPAAPTTSTPASGTAPSAITPAAPAVPTQSPEERFETQLASLRDMGFSDNSRNLRALLASGGDVESAIEFLLRM
ncbi:Ubiquilin-4 [Linnemannia zychae]|nr:Ubiquilin-4 [Linnemannia zychae]